MFLHIRGNMEIKATLVSNIIPAAPLKGMQVILNQPCAAQASQFAELVQMTLELDKHQDFTSIQLIQISIRVIMLKILASRMLQGNFAIKKVTSLKIEANQVKLSAFLPQRNKLLVERELSSKVKATSENVMDFADSHKTKGKTAIACIGTMHSMVDFSSFAPTWTQSSPPSVPTMSLSRSSVKSSSTLLPYSTTQTGYVGRITSARCLCFIGTVTVSSSKSSTALPTLPLILGRVISCPKLARSPSSIRAH